MATRNPNLSKLQKSYLFVEIAARKKQFLESSPDKKLISLGIGDTTEPLPGPIVEGISKKLKELTCRETYTGYPDYNGPEDLREKIANVFYNDKVTKDEVFVTDGSKPDLGRIQFLFDSSNTSIAVQDPVYPVYVDSAVISGKSGDLVGQGTGQYANITYMECSPETSFFPQLSKQPRTDLIYFCSPNNPTGTCATKEQLTELVQFARRNKSIIIFDSAYREFVSDASIPKSIYEIDGAREVAFETCSFSKLIGYTGVRCGWTVCPKELKYKCGSLVWDDWARIVGTIFNGPSNLATSGALASLSDRGMASMIELITYYMGNVALIKPVLVDAGLSVYGGVHSPYIWVKVPSYVKPRKTGGSSLGSSAAVESLSWAMFQELLEECCVVCTPGAGFGRGGEGYVRLSMFAHRHNVAEAAERLRQYLTKHKNSSTTVS